jgi:hypothetical protein
VAKYNSSDVSIQFGNGNGTFAAEINFDAGSASSDAVGDFNGDGRLDIAVADLGTNGVAILLNGCPDLTVSKTHAGNFTQGFGGQTYTITVNNIGSTHTFGQVTVTDNLPAGMSATAIFGDQWACTLATLTCTRGDRLYPGFSYEAITVFVSVNSNAPAMVTNTATVSGGSELNTANDTGSDPTTINPSGLIPPTNLVATATSTSQVTVTWDAVTPAVS